MVYDVAMRRYVLYYEQMFEEFVINHLSKLKDKEKRPNISNRA